ncbi:OsmC family protein [Paucilactobacillus sp. N302-9]
MSLLDKVLYHTEVENDAGLPGVSYVGNQEGMSLGVSSPLKPDAGTNPEQLVGLALATCLNATLQALEKREGLEHKSKVRVGIDMMHDTHGYQFKLDAQVLIPDQTPENAQRMLDIAETRCPVAKLLHGSDNVNVHIVDEFKF